MCRMARSRRTIQPEPIATGRRCRLERASIGQATWRELGPQSDPL